MGTDRTIHDIKITLRLHFGAAFLFSVKFFRRKILLLTIQFGEALHGSVPNWYCVNTTDIVRTAVLLSFR